jgi:hypothetical protein
MSWLQGVRNLLWRNRPVIEKRALKHFPYTWKLIEGTISHKSYQDDIIKALETHLRGTSKPEINNGHQSGDTGY